jgi:RimJ/RimL family protein N-acetyltransferase
MPDWFIREATGADAADFIAFFKQIADEPENGTTYDSAAQFTRSLEDQQELMQSTVEAENGLWLLAVTPDGQIIGETNSIGGKRARYGALSFGIAVAKDWRDQGIGTALLEELIAWCRQNPVVHRLELEVIASNARAIHVYEKLGFVTEGVRRNALKKHGQVLDTLMMAMIFDR